jgi:hypothetical protein
VVAPLLQLYVLPGEAVKTTDPPWQKVNEPPAETVAGGAETMVSVTAVLPALSQLKILFLLAA